MDSKEKLKAFVARFPDLSSTSHSRTIEILGYYIQSSSHETYFDGRSLSDSYEQLDLPKPKNFTDLLVKLQSRSRIVKFGRGYRLSKNVSEKIALELGNPELVTISTELGVLPSLLSGYEASFLEESISCLRVKAWRAAIVMSWILAMSHLEEYILTTNLSSFNMALSRNARYPGLTVHSKKDFEDIKEVDFIQIMRSAGIITNDQRKILEEKLGIRNSCAHPSVILITENKVASFLEDLVHNIITRFNIP